jgi:hypothetical protein
MGQLQRRKMLQVIMALLIFQSSNIPKLTEEYLSFEFYMLDISCNFKKHQEQLLDDVKREIDPVKDRVLSLKLRYYRAGGESFISIFKYLIKLSLCDVSLKAVNSVLNALSNSGVNLSHLSISLDPGYEYLEQSRHEQGGQIAKFSQPLLISLRLCRFVSSTIIEMFDFSNISFLKLIDCFLYDLPTSDTIEELEIEGCDKCTENAIYKILMLRNLRSLRLSANKMHSISKFIEVFLKLGSLRRISLSASMTIDDIIACLLKDGIQEIDFSGVRLICYDDASSIRDMSCALCATTAKKLHLNGCTLNTTMINVLKDNSRQIEYISLREILIVNDVNDGNTMKAFEAFKDLIEHAEFRVCDLRFIKEEYITSPITCSNIDKIIIDSRRDIMQKFSTLIESGKAIPIKTDVEVSFMRSFRECLYKRNTTLDVDILNKFYEKYFPVYYIDTTRSMEADLEEIIVISDVTEDDIALGIVNPLDNQQMINLSMEDNLCIRIKLPSNRRIFIDPKPDQEVRSNYDFTIVIRNDNKGQIEETRILCHKSILSSESEMFRAMFSVQMKENILNEMVTDNIYYKDFIQYLYTYRVNLNKENIIPLVELARMHFIKDLEYKILAYIHMHKEQMDIERCVLEKYDLLL